MERHEIEIVLCNYPCFMQIAVVGADAETDPQELGLMVLRSGLDREWLRTKGIIDYEFVVGATDSDKKTGRVTLGDKWEAIEVLESRLDTRTGGGG